MACESCVQELERQQPKDSHAGYVRGLLFGIGAAIVGMIFYAGFTIVTGIYIGYVSLAVGWLVGKAIMLGSKSIGGKRYQIAAVILTYAAVSLAAIPIAISYYVKATPESQSIQLKQQTLLPMPRRINLTRHNQSPNKVRAPYCCDYWRSDSRHPFWNCKTPFMELLDSSS